MRRFSLLLCCTLMLGGTVHAARAACAPPVMPPLTFAGAKIIDPVRAGGEPSIIATPHGTLVYAAHAGNTHLYKQNLPDEDFVAPYNGSIYVWWSDDMGETWHYTGNGLGDGGLTPAFGWSDPTLATDGSGNVYLGAQNPYATVPVAKSTDGGKTWETNIAAGHFTDRPWVAADDEDLVYVLLDEPRRRAIITSRDGGKTFNYGNGIPVSGTFSPPVVDQRTGTLYLPLTQSHNDFGFGTSVRIFRHLREGKTNAEQYELSLPTSHGFLVSSAIDAAGNVYIVSNTDRKVSISYSTDEGRSWSTRTIYTSTLGSIAWPWVSAGADGRVAVSWLKSDASASGQARGRFRIMAAQSITAHGYTDECGSHPPVWNVTTATPDPIHVGELCESGLNCNLAIGSQGDRRLGDYHTNAISPDGTFVVAYGNTTFKPDGAIAHPGFVRQSGGADFWP